MYTAFARDVARGVNRQWVRGLYEFAVKPTVAFYFRVALDEAMKRLRAARAGLKFYEAGADVGLADDLEESFRLFQGRIIDEYESMVDEFGLVVIDASLSDRGTTDAHAPGGRREISRSEAKRGARHG